MTPWLQLPQGLTAKDQHWGLPQGLSRGDACIPWAGDDALGFLRLVVLGLSEGLEMSLVDPKRAEGLSQQSGVPLFTPPESPWGMPCTLRTGAAVPFDLLAAKDTPLHFFTSGSTGGFGQRVTKSMGQLFCEARVLAEDHPLQSEGRVLAMVPPHHLYGFLFTFLKPLLQSAQVCWVPPTADVWDAQQRAQESGDWVMVPAHVPLFEAFASARVGKATRVFSSGAPLSAAMRGAICQGRWPHVLWNEVYGSTETGGVGVWELAVGLDPEAGWKPLRGVEVVAPHQQGGSYGVKSPWALPEGEGFLELADTLEPGLVKGRWRVVGRRDGVFKWAGKRFHTRELEQTAERLGWASPRAFWEEDASHPKGGRIWLFARAESGPNLTQARRLWRAHAEPLPMPEKFCFLPEFPVNPMGKTPFSLLREAWESRAKRGV